MRRATLVTMLGASLIGCIRTRDVPQERGGTPLSARGPVIRQLDSLAFRVILPAPMAQLLADSVPGFEPWPLAHYDRDLRAWYVVSHRSAPSAVIGDFNGDGVQDLVMEGHDGHRGLRLCLLSVGDAFRLIVLDSLPYDPTAPDARNSITYLAFRGPGRIGTNYTDSTMVLRADGFEVGYFEKAAVLYYWNGKEFAPLQTAD